MTTWLLDPCAGDGEAICELRRRWGAAEPDGTGAPAWRRSSLPSIVACEIEAERASALGDRLQPYRDQALHGDAFRLACAADDGATVLFLNPPYDHDPDHGRLEQRFLDRFTHFLHPGCGVLFFLVPHGALGASADFLAEHYLDLRGWRLPPGEFERFGQVLVVGRRARRPLRSGSTAATVRAWAASPERLPVLPERCPDPLPVAIPEEGHFDLRVSLEPLDLTAALVAFQPSVASATGDLAAASELVGAKFATAVPPKPAHIALALSAGMFNGHQLEPNDPARHPPILAKGVFERTHVEVSRRVDAEGETTGVVEIEQPRLRLTILRLDDYRFHELGAGTVPTGSADPAEWNAADLIGNYNQALAELLEGQFPPLHHPRRAEDQIALPRLARTPFRAQEQAIQPALKLMAQGLNPFFVAEVGTGKSTMALTVMAALSPEHHARTVAEIRRVGLPGPLPIVHRTLIVCPPHLLQSWTDQAEAVVPEARVRVVETTRDLDEPAEIYLLSRETAKLGHAWAGVEGCCPRCGAPVVTQASSNASRRLRCPAVPRRAVNLPAKLAEHLAALLAGALPQAPLVEDLVRDRGPLHRRLERPAAPLPDRLLADFLDLILGHLRRLWVGSSTEAVVGGSLLVCTVIEAVSALAEVTGGHAIVAATVEPLLAAGGEGRARPASWVRTALRGLVDRPEAPPIEPPTAAARRQRLLQLLERLHAEGTWEQGAPCGEPLYQALPRPRRVPLARQILRRYRRHFDLLILDEAHEFNHSSSAQAKAAHRLSGLPGVPTIVLTGSLMGGYASSLFTNFWALSPRFREEFGRDDCGAFVQRYGYRKTLREVKGGGTGDTRRGSHTDREIGTRTTLGEAPGVMPSFLMRHLLPTAIVVHKSDLDCELPPLEERSVPVEAAADDPQGIALLEEYRRLQRALLARIRADRFQKERSGRLLGALVELPSYLDRATADLDPFVLRYPEELGGEVVATGAQFPESWTTPKEAWLLGRLAAFLGRGERVIVFLRHTGTPQLPQRLLRLIRGLGVRAEWLDAKKVPTAKREAWIGRKVLEPGVDVLLVNPNAVRTGLNCLVAFSAAVWYETDLSATTYRQANGRLHRIGQSRPVTIEIPFYAGTAQEKLLDLIARKVSASLQVDGLDLQAALEAAGASDDHTAGIAAAMSLGQAVYDALIAAGP